MVGICWTLSRRSEAKILTRVYTTALLVQKYAGFIPSHVSVRPTGAMYIKEGKSSLTFFIVHGFVQS